MSCPYTATDSPTDVSFRPGSWTSISTINGIDRPAFGWANSSLLIGTLFPQFSVWDFEGRDVKYCNTWSAWCSDLKTIFKKAIFLRLCSLYPNTTSDISSGQLGANWTSAGFNTTDLALIRGLNSQIPSCLISYCALIAGCASKSHCLNANLYASDGSISMAGMISCTYDICYNWKPVVNSDFGGIGVSIVYRSCRSWLLTKLDDCFILDTDTHRAPRPRRTCLGPFAQTPSKEKRRESCSAYH